MSSCITVEDILEYPSCCDMADSLCCPHEAIEKNICRAIEMVEQLTQLTICPYEECKKFNGSGDCIQFFTPKTSDKLLELTSVRYLKDCDKYEEFTRDPENCHTSLRLCEESFPCGSKNIEICGTWGSFEVIPEGLKHAIMLLALEYSEPGLTGINSSQGMIDSVTWDDFSINYNTADISVTGGSTGFSQIDRILESYIPTRSKIKMGIVGRPCRDCCITHNKKDCKQCRE